MKTSKAIFGIGLGAAIALGSSVAAAAPETHDGFQFRGSLGIGYLAVGWEFLEQDHSLHGPAGASGFYFGGTPAPGLTIGGYFDGYGAIGPTYTVDGDEVGELDDDYSLQFAMVGPYIDYYLDPHGGFHLLGALGWASGVLTHDDTDVDVDATGFAFGLGLGYDWWVGDEWGLGILGRMNFASMEADDFNDATFGVVSPAVLFSFVYQ